MKTNPTTITGIDIGTRYVKVVIAERSNDEKEPKLKIIGTGLSKSQGLHHGHIIDIPQVFRSIQQARRQAEEAAGGEIQEAIISLGGTGLSAMTTEVSTRFPKSKIITDKDIEKMFKAGEKMLPPSLTEDRRIIHSIPISYTIDNQVVTDRQVEGRQGKLLKAKVFFVSALDQDIDNILKIFDDMGIEVSDILAAPLAASLVALTKEDKKAGCALAVIGAQTLSVAIFEHGIPISLRVFPIGTQDAQLDKIFGHIKSSIAETDYDGVLWAGVTLSGGGANQQGIDLIARLHLKLPAKAQFTFPGDTHSLGDPAWAVAYGLCYLKGD